MNFQGLGTSGVSRALREVRGKEGRGVQFGPPFLFFKFKKTF
jgi:hypothetical protein